MNFSVGKELKLVASKIAPCALLFGPPKNKKDLLIRCEQDGKITLEFSGINCYAKAQIRGDVKAPGIALMESDYITNLPDADSYICEIKDGRLVIQAGPYRFTVEVSNDESIFQRMALIDPVIDLPAEESLKFGRIGVLSVPYTKKATVQAGSSQIAVKLTFDSGKHICNFQAINDHEAIITDLSLPQSNFPDCILYVPGRIFERLWGAKFFEINGKIGFSNATPEESGIITFHDDVVSISYNTMSGDDFPHELSNLEDLLASPDTKPSTIDLDIDVAQISGPLNVFGRYLGSYPETAIWKDGENLKIGSRNQNADSGTVIDHAITANLITEKIKMAGKIFEVSNNVMAALDIPKYRLIDIENNAFLYNPDPNGPKAIIFIVKIVVI